MPKYTHKARPISEICEPARVGIEELIKTVNLPSDEKHKKATLDFIKEYTIDQGDLYTATFEDLSYADQAKSLNADLVLFLPKAIRAHVRRAASEGRDRAETLKTCIGLVAGLQAKLEADLKKGV